MPSSQTSYASGQRETPDEAVKVLERHADNKHLQHVFSSLASTWGNSYQDAAVA